MNRMRFLLPILLGSCLSSYVARPADLVTPGPIMCQAINQDVWDCRDALGRPWRCDVIYGRWSCYQLSIR